jgi:hypothetical protein
VHTHCVVWRAEITENSLRNNWTSCVLCKCVAVTRPVLNNSPSHWLIDSSLSPLFIDWMSLSFIHLLTRLLVKRFVVNFWFNCICGIKFIIADSLTLSLSHTLTHWTDSFTYWLIYSLFRLFCWLTEFLTHLLSDWLALSSVLSPTPCNWSNLFTHWLPHSVTLQQSSPLKWIM